MEFRSGSSVALADLEPVSAAELRAQALAYVRRGWRVAAFFGLPEADRPGAAGLCCILAPAEPGMLKALRTPPLEAFPSLTPECPQAHRFEREIFEQWGITPLGHPWLKPLRFLPGNPEGPGQCDFFRVEGDEIHEVAVGPVHAGVIEPGHFRFQCYGENVLHLEISLGYQHRGIEKFLRGKPDARSLPLVECIAGDSSVAYATAFCALLETLTGLDVPPRALALRRAALELERLANHSGDLGAIAGDTGFLPTASWNGRIRGDFLNMTALLCGNRFGRGLVRPGGAAPEPDARTRDALLERLDRTCRDLRGSVEVMLASGSVLERLKDTGVLPLAAARELGVVGMAARASGLALDARKNALLPGMSGPFAPPTEKGGDVLARSLLRVREAEDSARMVRAELEGFPELPAKAPCPARGAEFLSLPASRLAVAQVEGWRGEVCHAAVTGKQGEFLAYSATDPSFHNWSGLEIALRGEQISDFPLCNKSFNLSYCGHDL